MNRCRPLITSTDPSNAKNYDEGGGYEGEVDEEGRPDGRGVELVPSEHFYEGYFMEGKFNGRGRVIKTDANLYNGDWKDGKLHGFGFILWPTND